MMPAAGKIAQPHFSSGPLEARRRLLTTSMPTNSNAKVAGSLGRSPCNLRYCIIFSSEQDPSAPVKSSLEVASGSFSAASPSGQNRRADLENAPRTLSPGLRHELLMRCLFLQLCRGFKEVHLLQAGSPLRS